VVKGGGKCPKWNDCSLRSPINHWRYEFSNHTFIWHVLCDAYMFDWDESKVRSNVEKHGVGFSFAQRALLDSKRVIAEDITHSAEEQRYYCFGKIDGDIFIVRSTWRDNTIRIFGAGYWRKGKQVYEKENG
jgi:uncharacterized protein